MSLNKAFRNPIRDLQTETVHNVIGRIQLQKPTTPAHLNELAKKLEGGVNESIDYRYTICQHLRSRNQLSDLSKLIRNCGKEYQ